MMPVCLSFGCLRTLMDLSFLFVLIVPISTSTDLFPFTPFQVALTWIAQSAMGLWRQRTEPERMVEENSDGDTSGVGKKIGNTSRQPNCHKQYFDATFPRPKQWQTQTWWKDGQLPLSPLTSSQSFPGGQEGNPDP
ncbi:hypothetical protein F4778DRAFT_270257 [Xylariomycetidae sp. FL2044]|nr:hypothetical protein F4778DRAFT_270257 [Xylariomycetidae sp. FL2044]